MEEFIIRKHCGMGYKYFSKNNKEIKMTEEIQTFLKELYIPPAYKNVRINLKKSADIYAIGEDEKGRKQYLYRQQHFEDSNKQKFKKLIEFGLIYPKLKRDISSLLQKPEKSKEHEIGMVLKLMIDCNFRVGNNIYKKDNKSYGTTTLQGRHIHNSKGELEISFVGKKGVENTATVKDKRLIKSLKKMKFKKNNKQVFSIDSTDINYYLKKFGDFTSKDIRTWQANILFIKHICIIHNDKSKPKDTVKRASEITADLLHHTKEVSKKNYIFNELIEAYLKQTDKFINFFEKSPEKHFVCFLKKNIEKN